MSQNIKQFWNRLVASRLLTQNRRDDLQDQFESLSSVDQSDSTMLVDWLCKQKAISQFQADILDAGIDGPFRFGNYRILDPVFAEPGCFLYAGAHELTGHPVLIEFFSGQRVQDLTTWRKAKKLVRRLRTNPHPNLARSYEAVSIPEYRFIISELPRGKSLGSLLPDGARVNWKKATEIVSQIAAAARHASKQGLHLTRVSPELVWLGSKVVQIPPIYHSNPPSDANKLINSIGELWVRLILGSEGGTQELKTLPAPVYAIIEETRAADVDDHQMLKKLVKLGEKIREDAAPEKLAPRKTQSAYFSWLKRTPETILATDWTDVDQADLPFSEQTDVVDDIDSTNFLTAADDTESQFNRKKRSILVPLVSSFTVVAALAAVVVALTVNRPNSVAENTSTQNAEAVVNSEGPETGLVDSGENPKGADRSSEAVKPDNTIPDDGLTLWEPATAGDPVPFTHVPYSPALAFHLRWAALMASGSGQQTLKAFGPGINQSIENWRSLLGVADADLESVLVTLHTSDEFKYQAFTIAKLSKPYALSDLVSAWNAEKVVGETEEDTFYRGANDHCYVLLSVDGDSVEEFAMGSEQLAAECIELRDVSALSGGMKRVVEWSDQERHADIMFLTPGLFNDEGQKLMAGPMLQLNRQLSFLLDRSIRGGILGVHFDRDAYVEVRLDSTVDLKPESAEEHFKDLLAMAIDFANQESASGTAASYWQKVSQRYSAMLQNLQQSFRFGSEDRNLVANSWLPGVAVHNIVAGTELFLTVGYTPTTDQVVATSNPASIEELLQLPRDLSIATNPDLIVLLKNLQQEIRDDYASLPFEFEIRLIGADLAKEGITQNQRPSDIDMKQQPLSKILTEIMVKANPDKNITGPADPNCKMVWVLESDPANPERKIIMITTRGAAQEKGYTLPEDFQ